MAVEIRCALWTIIKEAELSKQSSSLTKRWIALLLKQRSWSSTCKPSAQFMKNRSLLLKRTDWSESKSSKWKNKSLRKPSLCLRVDWSNANLSNTLWPRTSLTISTSLGRPSSVFRMSSIWQMWRIKPLRISLTNFLMLPRMRPSIQRGFSLKRRANMLTASESFPKKTRKTWL